MILLTSNHTSIILKLNETISFQIEEMRGNVNIKICKNENTNYKKMEMY